MKTWSVTCTVVGLQFRWKESGRESLARSVPFKVELEREPDNQYDSNAIKVNIASDFKLKALRGRQLGYLRKEVALLLAPRIDAGAERPVKLWITEVDARAGEATLDARFQTVKPKGRK